MQRKDGFLSSVNAQPFSVSTRQDVEAQATTLAGYIASDLLWGKKENVSPTTETVTLQYQHIMAGVTIRLEQGTGFTADEWTALDKTLFVANTIPSGTVDLSTGAVEVGSSSTASIRPLYLNGNYRAVVFPQTVAAGKELIQIIIDGQTYSLKKAEAMTFASGKIHQFNVTVNRRIPKGDYVVTLAD